MIAFVVVQALVIVAALLVLHLRRRPRVADPVPEVVADAKTKVHRITPELVRFVAAGQTGIVRVRP